MPKPIPEVIGHLTAPAYATDCQHAEDWGTEAGAIAEELGNKTKQNPANHSSLFAIWMEALGRLAVIRAGLP